MSEIILDSEVVETKFKFDGVSQVQYNFEELAVEEVKKIVQPMSYIFKKVVTLMNVPEPNNVKKKQTGQTRVSISLDKAGACCAKVEFYIRSSGGILNENWEEEYLALKNDELENIKKIAATLMEGSGDDMTDEDSEALRVEVGNLISGSKLIEKVEDLDQFKSLQIRDPETNKVLVSAPALSSLKKIIVNDRFDYFQEVYSASVLTVGGSTSEIELSDNQRRTHRVNIPNSFENKNEKGVLSALGLSSQSFEIHFPRMDDNSVSVMAFKVVKPIKVIYPLSNEEALEIFKAYLENSSNAQQSFEF